MLLYFVRHGEATTTGDDWERTLTPAGANCIRSEAAVLRTLGVYPDYIFSSPLPRARQTAEILAEVLVGSREPEAVEELAPGAGLSEIGRLVERLPQEASALLVGHEPDLSTAIGLLISEKGARLDLKKGGVALVEVEAPFGPGRGVLKWLLEPRLLLSL
jgi:phosphohistidine phosphatase